MKSRWRSIVYLLVAHIPCVLTSRGGYCVFQLVFPMTRCFLIVCVLPMEMRLGVYGAQSCSISMILVDSIRLTFILNAQFSAKRLLLSCYHLRKTDLFQSG